ncbi:MAG: hypothetical protein IJT73_09490 [Selenomonadaceae bacterium]|nr:hypothetical protein [Selenomonadaceae bacterium]
MKDNQQKAKRKFKKPSILKQEKIRGAAGPCGRVCCADCGKLTWSGYGGY